MEKAEKNCLLYDITAINCVQEPITLKDQKIKDFLVVANVSPCKNGIELTPSANVLGLTTTFLF